MAICPNRLAHLFEERAQVSYRELPTTVRNVLPDKGIPDDVTIDGLDVMIADDQAFEEDGR